MDFIGDKSEGIADLTFAGEIEVILQWFRRFVIYD